MHTLRITLIALLLAALPVTTLVAQLPQNKLVTKAGTLTLTGLTRSGQLITVLSHYTSFKVDFADGTFTSMLNVNTFAGSDSFVDSLLMRVSADSLVSLMGTLNSPNFNPDADKMQEFVATGEMRYAGGVVSFDGRLRFRSLNTTYPFYLFTGELALFPDKKLTSVLIPGLLSPMHLSISQTLYRE